MIICRKFSPKCCIWRNINCNECFDYLESDCTPKQISLVYESLVNENAELRREIAELQKELQKYRDSE